MITRNFQKGDAASEAIYSDCQQYRYALTRIWDCTAPRLSYVMLNPSKATEARNDPTIERCERRARALGYGGFRVVNIFAWRETSPALLRRAAAPVGPDNDAALRAACAWSDRVICGWGTHGAFMRQGERAAALLHATGADICHLGLTKDGHPKHPLYISYGVRPQRWAL